MDCLFCRIVEGSVPALKIMENDKFIAFLDINPRTEGHCLIIPKKHVSSFSDMSNEQTGDMFVFVKEVASRLTESLDAKGYNIFINNGKAAGQIISHFHVHIMPRYENEGIVIEAAFPVSEDAKQKIKETQQKLEEQPANKYTKEIISW